MTTPTRDHNLNHDQNNDHDDERTRTGSVRPTMTVTATATAARTGGRALVVVAVAVLLVGGLFVAATPAAAAGSASAQEAPNGSDNSTATPTPTATPTATPTNGSSPGNATGSGPTLATQTRVTAVSFDQEYLNVQRTGDDQWNTTGPYAVFALSETATAARVTQPKAQARLLDGGRTIEVTFRPDAAPEGNPSFYEVEVFFADGSQRTLTVFARDTEQVAVSPSVKEGQELIELMQEDAEAHGFGTSVDQLVEYHKWEREQADLLNDLFSEQLKRWLAWLIITARTPFALLTIALVLLYLLRRIIKTHGWKLTAQLRGGDGSADLRRRVMEDYRRQQVAADQKRLEELDTIGPQWVAWQDAYGVSSVKQLADLFKEGQPKHDGEGNLIRNTDADPLTDANGEEVTDRAGNPVYPPKMAHHGVDDLLEAEDLRETWLEPILRDERLGSTSSALAQAWQALVTITTEFGQAEYERTRSKVRELVNREANDDRASSMVSGTTANAYGQDHGATSGPPANQHGQDHGHGSAQGVSDD